jgi:glycine/D-amino acid oxidase-like deaminating enzyme
MSRTDYDAVIIGGGIVGCSLALYLKAHLDKVLILEREATILQRASYANQARVHNGYHYPRSLLTALRSRLNFPRFVEEYRDCIDQSFAMYYGVGKLFSKVTATQFKTFCQRINAPLEPAPKEIKRLFNRDLVEEVFLVQEFAFDAVKLRNKLLTKIRQEGVQLKTNCHVVKIIAAPCTTLEVVCDTGREHTSIAAKHVFNCTYSQINQILAASSLTLIPLKYELAEIALVELPDCLQNAGITIMCGPFFSVMPFPPQGLHTFSHVRYTPHHSWRDSEGAGYLDANEYFKRASHVSNYPYMVKDAQRYLPILKECQYMDSLWEVKTVLPSSEVDDSRPILFRQDHGLKNLTCILGGKIDNIYDMLDEMEALRTQGRLDL